MNCRHFWCVFLLTKLEQDLLATQPLGQEAPLDREEQLRR
jgi:hypothetical protein